MSGPSFPQTNQKSAETQRDPGRYKYNCDTISAAPGTGPQRKLCRLSFSNQHTSQGTKRGPGTFGASPEVTRLVGDEAEAGPRGSWPPNLGRAGAPSAGFCPPPPRRPHSFTRPSGLATEHPSAEEGSGADPWLQAAALPWARILGLGRSHSLQGHLASTRKRP